MYLFTVFVVDIKTYIKQKQFFIVIKIHLMQIVIIDYNIFGEMATLCVYMNNSNGGKCYNLNLIATRKKCFCTQK